MDAMKKQSSIDAIMDHFQFSNPYELISKYHNFENETTTVAQL